MYDPSTARFISEDPISFEGGTPNLYGYVENNPVNATDPSGTTSAELTLLLNIATPKQGSNTIYRYPESLNYSLAFGTASYWYSLITEPNYSPKSPSNTKPGVNIAWLVNAPLKGGAGVSNLRPTGSSGPDPTIDLFADKNKRKHNTPGHASAKEIKFEWEDSDKQCVMQPEIPTIFAGLPSKPKNKSFHLPTPPPLPEPDLDLIPGLLLGIGEILRQIGKLSEFPI